MAPVRAIFLLIVGLALTVSAHSFSVHRRHGTVNPFVGETIARTSHLEGLDEHRFTDFPFQGRSAKDPQQAAHQEDNIVTSSEWRESEALGGILGSQTRRIVRSRLPVKPQKLGALETPIAKPWPEEFTVNFTTKSGAATGFIAYDWSQNRQVVYHGPNSTYCSSFGTDNACQMFQFPGGTYVYIPSLKQCFLSVAEVGSLPPEWTTYSEYVGVEDVPGVGLCRSFAFPPTVHVWYETVVGSLPCLFVFPEPTMSYYFLPETVEVGTPDEKYFDFPDYCFSAGDTVIRKLV